MTAEHRLEAGCEVRYGCPQGSEAAPQKATVSRLSFFLAEMQFRFRCYRTPWIWKRRMSSAVAVLGERSRKAAKPQTVRM